MWGDIRGVSVSGVQVQYSELRTDGWTHLHNTLICCKAGYGNHARSMCRKHAATGMPETNSEGTAGRQPRRTDRKPAAMNRPGSGREQPTGYWLSGTCRSQSEERD